LKIIALILLLPVLAAAVSPGSSEAVIKDYLNVVRSGNRKQAQTFWNKTDIERSKHLGIKFTGIDTKYDCASPLIFGGESVANSITGCTYSAEMIDSQTAIVTATLKFAGRDSSLIDYYLRKTQDNWRICSSLEIYTGDWYVLPTKYFNIHFSDSSLVNDYALAELDSCVEHIAEILRVPSGKLDKLTKLKIDYYLCDKSQMAQLTGHDAEGMTSYAYDAIITHHLPHEHELVHLLINYKLGEVPLFTLPIAQEGLACCIGGRWGKTARVIDYWGSAVQTLGLVDIDSLLTGGGFNGRASGPDAAYAASSLLAQTLIDNYGMEKFIEFYLKLSGDVVYINKLIMPEIIGIAESIFGVDWATIKIAYLKTAEIYSSGDIQPTNFNFSNKTPIYNDASNGLGIWESPELYIFQIALPDNKTAGAILIGKASVINPRYRSRLFIQQYPELAYNNDIYGIRFSVGEVGLYDYLTNILKAKYVFGFFPDERFYDDKAKVVVFAIDKKLMKIRPSETSTRIVFTDH
jgi:hypothetical protein